ncbi:MAG: ATPase, T2SS/T4P/T4SS family [Candidatus Hodarchaeales archaeon]
MVLVDLVINQKSGSLINSYKFLCYKALIRRDKLSSNIEYQVIYDEVVMGELKNFNLYEGLLKSTIEELIVKTQDFISLDELFSFVSNLKGEILGFSEHLIIPVLFRILKMERLGPLLVDNQIDEIYLDSSQSYIYIDHARYGRCSTQIRLRKQEIESFIHRVALENDFNLNRENPTMKGDFVTKLFHTRITVDIPPLLIDDVHLDIRKFHPHNLHLEDLIKSGSIPQSQGNFLREIMNNLVSLSIIGPPNSGKTTLQNALLEYIPPHFRILSVEDVLETSNLRIGNQVRFRLGYDPNERNIYTKAMEIQKLLHRSPDYVNLGELSTKDNFLAFLNILSVGIPSIQTIHGRNPNYLLLRLQDVYKIPISLIKTSFPHVFVEMDTLWVENIRKRFIIRIAELTPEGEIIIVSDRQSDRFNDLLIDKQNSYSLNFLQDRKNGIL